MRHNKAAGAVLAVLVGAAIGQCTRTMTSPLAAQAVPDCAGWTSRAIGSASYVVTVDGVDAGGFQRWDTAMRLAITLESQNPLRDVQVRQAVRIECPIPSQPPALARVPYVLLVPDSLRLTTINEHIQFPIPIVMDTLDRPISIPFVVTIRDPLVLRPEGISETSTTVRGVISNAYGTSWVVITAAGARPDSMFVRVAPAVVVPPTGPPIVVSDTGAFAAPDIASHNFEDGTLGPYREGGGVVTPNITVAADPSGTGKALKLTFQGVADQNRAIVLPTYTLGYGATIYARGHVLIPAGVDPNVMRKLLYFNPPSTSSGFVVVRIDGNTLGMFWRTELGLGVGNLSGPTVQAGRRYSVEVQITLNSAASVADGIFRQWVDGALVMEKLNIRLASAPFNVWRIGQQAQRWDLGAVDELRYWDNIAFSTRRIGP